MVSSGPGQNMRACLAILGAAVLSGTSLLAHHSYGDILREQTVTIEGTLENILFANPHVMLRVRTDAGETYNVEWGNLIQLRREGVDTDMLAAGDRVVVAGSPHRDPAILKLTLLSQVRDLKAGWHWTKGAGIAR
jgi:uncharacterized protein DUF6152